jgi:GTP-binding protein HflX
LLHEIGADGAPVLLVLNKRDRLEPGREEELAAELPHAILVSAKRPEDVARLRERILAFFEQEMEETELHVPYTRQKLLAEIHEGYRVLSESHDEQGTLVRLRARPEQIARLRAALEQAGR